MNLSVRNFTLFLFILVTFLFFQPIFLRGMLPIPADTIVGLYHPYRDVYASQYPNGIPFKNFLITDPVRQQYPWRLLVKDSEKQFSLPLWNPYSFAGTPLLANFQNGAFYPLTALFFVFPASVAWTLLIVSQPLLAGIFMYLFLRNGRSSLFASFLGAVTFAFCGFAVSWMEWGTIMHVGLWLPLILLSIDKIIISLQSQKISYFKFKISNKQIKFQKKIFWTLGFVLTLTCAFFAGHLQTFFYLLLVSLAYLLARWWQYGRSWKMIVVFSFCFLLFAIITAIQWIPTVQFILLSARSVDQANWLQPEWFIPWQHLIQFVAPDFFGNPSTLNYWGVWNYGEFIGYIGIFPLLLAFYALFFRRDKRTLFFGTMFFLSIIFALPTFFAKLPYVLQIPFLSTAQPTRLLFITDFSLSVLAAFGLDYLLNKRRGIIYAMGFLALVFIGLWGIVQFAPEMNSELAKHSLTIKRNLFLPTIIFLVTSFLIILTLLLQEKYQKIGIVMLLGVTVFDLLRFAGKYESFSSQAYLFPQTKIVRFLQHQPGQFRILSKDSAIFPPNFSAFYHLQSVDGYDPLYVQRYAELLVASERNKPDITPPFGFNRIITPHNYNSHIIDLLGVTYILSLSDITSEKFSLIMQEGQTKLFVNKNALPRVFFVSTVKKVETKQSAIKELFADDFDPKKQAIVEDEGRGVPTVSPCVSCSVHILQYANNAITLETNTKTNSFLVMTDTYYPTWHASIDTAEVPIYRTNYNFRGIVVPSGKHSIVFQNRLF